jgi:hypothetical protein
MTDDSFLERIGSPYSILRNEPSSMYHTTGFTRDQVVEPCAQVLAANEVATESEKVTWPPILGLFTSVVATLTSLESETFWGGRTVSGAELGGECRRTGPLTPTGGG